MKSVLVEDLKDLEEIIYSWEKDSTVKSILILGTFKSTFYKNFKSLKLSSISKNFWGCFFPIVFQGNIKSETGVVCIGFEHEFKVQLIDNLSETSTSIETKIVNMKLNESNAKTTMLFIDAFAPNVEEVISTVFNIYGLESSYFGAGCGDLDFVQKPCIFTREGLFEDAAVFASTSTESAIGVSHGCDALADSMRVTKSIKNIVYEIEYRPAFLVYQEIVNKHSPDKIAAHNFFDVARNFPFGIPQLENEYTIRDPLKLGENNSIEFVANVPENSFIYIMKSSKESLINGAYEAVRATGDKQSNSTIIVMDCISRALFLEHDFIKELQALTELGNNSVGASVFGEIANQGKNYLEFHNKTIVVCDFKNDK